MGYAAARDAKLLKDFYFHRDLPLPAAGLAVREGYRMPHRPPTPRRGEASRQAGPQAGLLPTRARLAFDRRNVVAANNK